MSIILGIIGVLLGIGLVIWLVGIVFGLVVIIVKYTAIAVWYILKFAFYLSIPVGLIALHVYLFQLIGWYALAVAAGFVLIGVLIYRNRPETLESRVKRYFQEYEMASGDDLLTRVDGNVEADALIDVLNRFIKRGLVEEVDFGANNDSLFRWTEKRHYAQGVVTKHITLD
ncbi:hypothetical protein MO973_25220 [Paenibacillus sp. TRM 82003]|nr:hypothetical protein [Paenibacillus sp. TRM 82003]